MRKLIDKNEALLDSLAELFPESSRTTLRQMLQSGRIRVNGEIENNARRLLASGDVVDVGKKEAVRHLPRQLAVLHEDEYLIVVIKEHGLLSVSAPGEKEETAQAYLNAYLRTRDGRDRIHVVHRLDRDTSGVMLFAKDFETRQMLKETFAEHDIDRVYVALIEGVMPERRGTIRSNLDEDSTYTVRSVPSPRGKPAVTHYETMKAGSRYAMMKVTLETGRKNQIRVHFSESGHPVVGDEKYGATTNPIGRLALHAHLLGFRHPHTGKMLTFTAPIPDAFVKLAL